MSERRPALELAAAALTFGAAIALYTWTLAPTVTLIDSGELILAAHGLGVAHPPGFPFYLLLAHLATLVPVGTVAARVNFASAVFGALAVAVMTLVVAEATREHTRRHPIRAQKQTRDGKESKPAVAAASTKRGATQQLVERLVPCVAAGLFLAFSRTLWAYATVAEVYTLNTLLILIVFLLMFRWRRAVLDASTPAAHTDASLQAAAFVFGLALGVHHVSVALMLPALAVLVWATEGRAFFASRRVLLAALFASAGLAIYVYLPLAASKSPLMNWGDPRTFERVWWHITGKQYRANLSFSLQSVSGQFGEFVSLAARELGPVWLPLVPGLALAGLLALYRSNKTMFWLLALVMAADLSYALGYDIAEDKDAYFLPVFVAIVISAGFGVKWLVDRMRSAAFGVSPYIAGVLMLAPLVALAANLPYNNRSRYFIASDYVDNIMAGIEPRGMLLTSDWQVYSPMLYTREIERRRDDVVVIDINLLRRSWYYGYLNRAYPATLAQAHTQVDAFVEELQRWDHDPGLYERSPALNQRINSRFNEMVMAFVRNHQRSAPVYATLDVPGSRDALTTLLRASYQFVPRGLVFQLSGGSAAPAVQLNLVTRGLNDGTLRFASNDVVTLKVLPVYTLMMYNQGRQLAAAGRHDQAVESYKRALSIDANFALARNALDESAGPTR